MPSNNRSPSYHYLHVTCWTSIMSVTVSHIPFHVSLADRQLHGVHLSSVGPRVLQFPPLRTSACLAKVSPDKAGSVWDDGVSAAVVWLIIGVPFDDYKLLQKILFRFQPLCVLLFLFWELIAMSSWSHRDGLTDQCVNIYPSSWQLVNCVCSMCLRVEHMEHFGIVCDSFLR